MELRLLGGFSFTDHGREQPLSRGGQRLLAHLALHPGRDRESVAGMLWPEVSAGQALGSLRSTLWRLQRSGVRVLTAGSSLALPADVHVDVQRLQTTMHEVSSGAPVDEGQAWLWSTQDDELLPGWYEDWVLFERERLRQLKLHVGEAMAESLCRAGRYAASLQVALTVVRLEPLRESAHRLVIRVHLAEGNVGEAARQYRSCCRLLRTELGVGPSPLLRGLLPPVPRPFTAPQRAPALSS